MTAQAAASANQARAANYKYTSNMRNPPSQPTAMVAQPIQQAVHVKGKSFFFVFKPVSVTLFIIMELVYKMKKINRRFEGLYRSFRNVWR